MSRQCGCQVPQCLARGLAGPCFEVEKVKFTAKFGVSSCNYPRIIACRGETPSTQMTVNRARPEGPVECGAAFFIALFKKKVKKKRAGTPTATGANRIRSSTTHEPKRRQKSEVK